ncbi:MAG: DUF1553 domain-containing protein [Planctomycetia bacterium]|nr:DUF1553 domain-containing protein [Planctomycetia bacterium]
MPALRFPWIPIVLCCCGFAYGKPPIPTAPAPERALFEQDDGLKARNKIDEIVLADLKKKNLQPALLCSDGVFLRRVYQDIVGGIPTPEEARAFLDDPALDKRAKLVDHLLSSPRFDDWQTLRWCDLLRVKSEFPINLWPHGAATYYRWLHEAVRTNMPYDQFARALLLGEGSNFRSGPANFYRAVERKEPDVLAEAVAQVFLGSRTDLWPEEKRNALIVFFSRLKYKATAQWKEEIVYRDRTPLESNRVTFPDGTTGEVLPGRDPRRVFADWLIRPENRAFHRAIANRLWFWATGQGIVHPPDDVRETNPPVCPELLDFLADELVRQKYDLKAIYRLILNSRTYQQSTFAREKDLEKARTHLAVYPVRRLEAEVLQDMLIQIFKLQIPYTSEVPEPFAYLPPRMQTIQIQDSGVTSAFLEMFGRSTRDSGLLADRSNEVNESQLLFMMNATDLNNWVNRVTPQFTRSLPKSDHPKWNDRCREVADSLWLAFLSRYPSESEREMFRQMVRAGYTREVVWAMVNTREFICHH